MLGTIRSAAIAAWAIVLLLPLSASSADARDAMPGTWVTDGGDSKVEISRTGSSYGGRIVWLKEPERGGKPVRDVAIAANRATVAMPGCEPLTHPASSAETSTTASSA